jgi:hypothetical protein
MKHGVIAGMIDDAAYVRRVLTRHAKALMDHRTAWQAQPPDSRCGFWDWQDAADHIDNCRSDLRDALRRAVDPGDMGQMALDMELRRLDVKLRLLKALKDGSGILSAGELALVIGRAAHALCGMALERKEF